MVSEVNITVDESSLSGSSDNAHVKIGISNIGTEEAVLITGSMTPEKIRMRLGSTPLADACMDSVENGAKAVYCIPVAPEIQGSIGEIIFSGTGTGTITSFGKPNNDYDILITILESGNTNEGTFKVSIDGGVSYTEEITIPLGKTYIVGDTGITLQFSDAESLEEGTASFQAGDTYSLRATAPAMSNAQVIKAVKSLINFNKDYEYIHIVGATGRACWASLAQLAEEFATTHKKPIAFVCEARKKAVEESMEEYVAAMAGERKGIDSYRLQVITAYATYLRKDGRTQDISMAGVLCGLYSQAKQSQSIGEIKSFPLSASKVLKLLPAGIEDYFKELDELGYVTIRQYAGKDDFYVTCANMFAKEGSSFRYMEDVRVLDRIIKDVRLQALDNLQIEVDPTQIKAGLAILEQNLNIPIDKAVNDGIIAKGEVTLETENVNILKDESINAHVSYVPMGHLRTINVTFAVYNPYMEE